MKKKIAKKLRQRKQKILNRLNKRSLPEHPGPMFNPGNIHYEMADRARGIAYGGMGAMQLLVKNLGLDEAINRRLRNRSVMGGKKLVITSWLVSRQASRNLPPHFLAKGANCLFCKCQLVLDKKSFGQRAKLGLPGGNFALWGPERFFVSPTSN